MNSAPLAVKAVRVAAVPWLLAAVFVFLLSGADSAWAETIPWGAPQAQSSDGSILPLEPQVWDYLYVYDRYLLDEKHWEKMTLKAQRELLASMALPAKRLHREYRQLLEETDPGKGPPGASPDQLKKKFAKDLERLKAEGQGVTVKKFGKVGAKSGEPYADEINKRIVEIRQLLQKTQVEKQAQQADKTREKYEAKEKESQKLKQEVAGGDDQSIKGKSDKIFDNKKETKKTVPSGPEKLPAGPGKDKLARLQKDVPEQRRLKEGTVEKDQSKYLKTPDVPTLQQKGSSPKTLGGLDVEKLKRRGYTDQNIADLNESIVKGSGAVQDLHSKHPSAVGDAYGSGTMTNIEDTAKRVFAGGNLERGCKSHQAATISAMPKDTSLEYKKIVIGKGMEHHAVVAYPKGTDWRNTGVVLDGWDSQSSDPDKMVFTRRQWTTRYTSGLRIHGYLREAELED